MLSNFADVLRSSLSLGLTYRQRMGKRSWPPSPGLGALCNWAMGSWKRAMCETHFHIQDAGVHHGESFTTSMPRGVKRGI